MPSAVYDQVINALIARINDVDSRVKELERADRAAADASATANTLLLRDGSANGALALLSANGVSFPATQVTNAGANVLDDYEEGTFTPGVGGGVTLGNGTLSGVYTKIGNLVYMQIKFTWGSTTSLPGAVTFTGLPFTSAIETPAYGYCLRQGVGYYFAHTQVLASSTSTAGLSQAGGASVSATSPATWTNGDIFVLSGVYRV